jgi:hypothetical protein
MELVADDRDGGELFVGGPDAGGVAVLVELADPVLTIQVRSTQRARGQNVRRRPLRIFAARCSPDTEPQKASARRLNLAFAAAPECSAHALREHLLMPRGVTFPCLIFQAPTSLATSQRAAGVLLEFSSRVDPWHAHRARVAAINQTAILARAVSGDPAGVAIEATITLSGFCRRPSSTRRPNDSGRYFSLCQSRAQAASRAGAGGSGRDHVGVSRAVAP